MNEKTLILTLEELKGKEDLYRFLSNNKNNILLSFGKVRGLEVYWEIIFIDEQNKKILLLSEQILMPGPERVDKNDVNLCISKLLRKVCLYDVGYILKNGNDSCWLLSVDEVKKYIPITTDRQVKFTISEYPELMYGVNGYAWLLRCSGDNSDMVPYADAYGEVNYIHIDISTSFNTMYGIRPACWVDLSKLE